MAHTEKLKAQKQVECFLTFETLKVIKDRMIWVFDVSLVKFCQSWKDIGPISATSANGSSWVKSILYLWVKKGKAMLVVVSIDPILSLIAWFWGCFNKETEKGWVIRGRFKFCYKRGGEVLVPKIR